MPTRAAVSSSLASERFRNSRDSAGNVTYKNVSLDGLLQQINETVPSAFALGWAQVLLTNFQIDGLGGYGSATVYLDQLTVTRW